MANKERSMKEASDSDPYFWTKQEIRALENKKFSKGLLIAERERLERLYKELQINLPFGETE